MLTASGPYYEQDAFESLDDESNVKIFSVQHLRIQMIFLEPGFSIAVLFFEYRRSRLQHPNLNSQMFLIEVFSAMSCSFLLSAEVAVTLSALLVCRLCLTNVEYLL